VGAAAELVGAKVASVKTAPATDGSASAPAETKVVPVGNFAALKPGGRAGVFADAEAAPVEEPQHTKLRGHWLPPRGARQRLVTGLQRERLTGR